MYAHKKLACMHTKNWQSTPYQQKKISAICNVKNGDLDHKLKWKRTNCYMYNIVPLKEKNNVLSARKCEYAWEIMYFIVFAMFNRPYQSFWFCSKWVMKQKTQMHEIKLTLRGYCTSYPKISMLCALSQNYQYLFQKYMHLIVNCPRNSKIALKFR